MTAVSDETGRDWLPLKYEDGPDFCTVTLATGAAFALTVYPERMKLMEAALSASPVAQEPVARLCGYCKTWNSKPCGEQCYLQPSDPVWTAPVAQEPVARLVPIKNLVAMLALLPPAPVDVNGKQFAYHDPKAAERLLELRSVFDALIAASPLYTSPPATPAGVGADEIARVFVRWKKSKNLHESLAAQNIEKELLALLSRAGDQK